MGFLYRNAPTYKGVAAAAPKQTTSSLLGAVLGSLLGGVTPSYRNVSGTSARAQASSTSWWPWSQTPSYKTASAVLTTADTSIASLPNLGDEASEPACPEPVTQVVIL